MTDDDRETLELFAEKTYRLILRLPEVDRESLETAVEDTFDVELEEVDVSEFSPAASRHEFESESVTGAVSVDVDGNTVLTLRDVVYVDDAAERLEELDHLLKVDALSESAERLREFDADENPLEKVL